MGKMMAFVQLALVCLLQVATDYMLIGTLVQDFAWHDYLLGFAALVALSATLVKLSWREWKTECNK